MSSSSNSDFEILDKDDLPVCTEAIPSSLPSPIPIDSTAPSNVPGSTTKSKSSNLDRLVNEASLFVGKNPLTASTPIHRSRRHLAGGRAHRSISLDTAASSSQHSLPPRSASAHSPPQVVSESPSKLDSDLATTLPPSPSVNTISIPRVSNQSKENLPLSVETSSPSQVTQIAVSSEETITSPAVVSTTQPSSLVSLLPESFDETDLLFQERDLWVCQPGQSQSALNKYRPTRSLFEYCYKNIHDSACRKFLTDIQPWVSFCRLHPDSFADISLPILDCTGTAYPQLSNSSPSALDCISVNTAALQSRKSVSSVVPK